MPTHIPLNIFLHRLLHNCSCFSSLDACTYVSPIRRMFSLQHNHSCMHVSCSTYYLRGKATPIAFMVLAWSIGYVNKAIVPKGFRAEDIFAGKLRRKTIIAGLDYETSIRKCSYFVFISFLLAFIYGKTKGHQQ